MLDLFMKKSKNGLQRKEDKGEMKNLKCEECAFFDELNTEQPCCYCFDNIHFEERMEEYDHPTEKGGD